jgi:hypothetical protein
MSFVTGSEVALRIVYEFRTATRRAKSKLLAFVLGPMG